MATAKTPITQLAEGPPAQLPVTVEAVIGHIDMGKPGHPFETAMGIIGRYHGELLDSGYQSGDHIYRFQGPGELETIVVNIRSEFSSPSS